MGANIVNKRVNVYLIKNNNVFSSYVITYDCVHVKEIKKPQKCDICVEVNQYCYKLFYATIVNSMNLRAHVLKFSQVPNLNASIVLHSKQPLADIDHLGGGYLQTMIHEKVMCDIAMSYLSTLGGAFSALGDSFVHCAEKAGEISMRQYQIALRSQEEPLLARCRLYMALSLIQQGSFQFAKKMILEQATIAKKFKDFRLKNMCKGVWSKLQYSKSIQNNQSFAQTF